MGVNGRFCKRRLCDKSRPCHVVRHEYVIEYPLLHLIFDIATQTLIAFDVKTMVELRKFEHPCAGAATKSNAARAMYIFAACPVSSQRSADIGAELLPFLFSNC